MKKILGAYRLGGRVFKPNKPEDVDALAKAATPSQLRSLMKEGVISGDWLPVQMPQQDGSQSQQSTAGDGQPPRAPRPGRADA